MTKNQKLIVEVVDARNLLPKDGHGTSSPYVTVDFHGQRKRTKTAIRDLNPTWNEVFEFNVGEPSIVFDNILELDISHDKIYGHTRRNVHLGRIRLSSSQFVKKGEEALIYYSLERKYLLNWVQGEIGLKIYYQDKVIPPPPPPPAAPAGEVKPDSNTTPPAEASEEKPPESEPTAPPAEEVKPDDSNAEPPPAEKPPADNAPAPIQVEKPPESEPAKPPPPPLEANESQNQKF